MINFNDFDIDETEILTDSKFVDFLRKYKYYDKFMTNLKNEMKTSNGFYKEYWTDIDAFCDEVDTDKYISSAFDWVYSPEGYKFWKAAHYNWLSFFRKIKNT